MAGMLAGATLVVIVLRSCAIGSCLIPSDGMSPTLLPGERILVDKWSYGLRLPLMRWWGYHRWKPETARRGDVLLFNNPANRREAVISRREVFIGRCMGVPGDCLTVDSLFNLLPPQQPIDEATYRQATAATIVSRLADYVELRTSRPLLPPEQADSLMPPHRLVIPARGRAVAVEAWNCALLCNTLVLHEGRQAEMRNDTLYVDGRPAMQCCFSQNYYWITTDNPGSLSGSRMFGLVPESHLIGRASLVWFSKEPGGGWLHGYRPGRMGKTVE